MLTTEGRRTEEHRQDKPRLPVLLLSVIHQQTLAQKALALLSTETSELEFWVLSLFEKSRFTTSCASFCVKSQQIPEQLRTNPLARFPLICLYARRKEDSNSHRVKLKHKSSFVSEVFMSSPDRFALGVGVLEAQLLQFAASVKLIVAVTDVRPLSAKARHSPWRRGNEEEDAVPPSPPT
ncbi:hypothetical protein EYF80_036993 [Liparis tanakae]|uniref:Uncharacterized protein n=1 Tax=Liparis tanakae TaxID=230148 RepID=A0A4Z2GHG6_9TELE|nr:hypothetical protein EYF80_036993 [Liparis tanakae]